MIARWDRKSRWCRVRWTWTQLIQTSRANVFSRKGETSRSWLHAQFSGCAPDQLVWMQWLWRWGSLVKQNNDRKIVGGYERRIRDLRCSRDYHPFFVLNEIINPIVARRALRDSYLYNYINYNIKIIIFFHRFLFRGKNRLKVRYDLLYRTLELF